MLLVTWVKVLAVVSRGKTSELRRVLPGRSALDRKAMGLPFDRGESEALPVVLVTWVVAVVVSREASRLRSGFCPVRSLDRRRCGCHCR